MKRVALGASLPLFNTQAEALPVAATPPPPTRPPAVPMQAARRLPQELWAAVQRPVLLPEAAQAQPTLEALAAQAQRYTPRVSLAPPDALLLELRGSLGLFGGLAALFTELQTRYAGVGTLALAPTPLAALALARAGKSCCITDPARLVSRLAVLPLSCLRWSEQALARLASMGVRTIGEALRLPREGFAQRFGPALLDALDRLVGRSPDPRLAYEPPPRFRQRCEPSFELADKAFVLQTIMPALQALETFLCERQRGITALLLQLEHRNHPPTRCVLRLALPEHRAAQFALLLEARLQDCVLPAPVRRCELRAGALLPYAAVSDALWQPGEHGGGAAAAMPAFIERLRARLGPDSVQGLCLLPGHRPERVSGVREPAPPGATLRRSAQAVAAALPWAAGRRPLWLLREPLPLAAAADGSGYPAQQGQRLALLAGPERLETGWWDGSDIARDYYVATDPDGARLWIFRERDGSQGWFLHGLFG